MRLLFCSNRILNSKNSCDNIIKFLTKSFSVKTQSLFYATYFFPPYLVKGNSPQKASIGSYHLSLCSLAGANWHKRGESAINT